MSRPMSVSKITVRPATREDIDAFSDMADKPTIRAVAAERDGRIIGIGGIAFSGGRWFGFIDLADEMRPHKMTIARAAIRFLSEARSNGIRYIYAEVSPKEPGAAAWLHSLGFRLDARSQRYYRWSAE